VVDLFASHLLSAALRVSRDDARCLSIANDELASFVTIEELTVPCRRALPV
jgi:hypothetical protein